ncbi:MAG TPA: hypothetical protein VLV86_04785 [Vicinamibacterales bacterium]|nr:hypothetical protein [Vicinamibacterales bacterium]
MRLFVFALSLAGSLFIAGEVPLVAADNACALLTQMQVGSALGVPVGAGAPIGRPSACQWAGKGKIATLTITQPLAGKSPVDRFNTGKTSTLPGITQEPVSGVGDDAFFVYYANTTRAGLGIVVKKGTSAFEVRVYGFDINDAKAVAKNLATNALGKL